MSAKRDAGILIPSAVAWFAAAEKPRMSAQMMSSRGSGEGWTALSSVNRDALLPDDRVGCGPQFMSSRKNRTFLPSLRLRPKSSLYS